MQINETNSYTEYTTTEPTTDFVVGFEYFNNKSIDTVNITVDNTDAVTAGYTVSKVNDSVFRLTPAVPSGSTVRLLRETDLDAPIHKFSEGALFRAPNVDANFKQILHAQQEVRDGFTKLSSDTYQIIDTLEQVAQDAQEAADAANNAAIDASNAAQAVGNKIDRKEGAALPYDPTIPYMDTAVVVKDGELQQKQGNSWVSLIKNNDSVDSIQGMLDINNPKSNAIVYVFGGKQKGYFKYNSSRSTENDGGTVFNGWERIDFEAITFDMFGLDSTGNTAIDDKLLKVCLASTTLKKPIHNFTGTYLVNSSNEFIFTEDTLLDGSVFKLGSDFNGSFTCKRSDVESVTLTSGEYFDSAKLVGTLQAGRFALNGATVFCNKYKNYYAEFQESTPLYSYRAVTKSVRFFTRILNSARLENSPYFPVNFTNLTSIKLQSVANSVRLYSGFTFDETNANSVGMYFKVQQSNAVCLRNTRYIDNSEVARSVNQYRLAVSDCFNILIEDLDASSALYNSSNTYNYTLSLDSSYDVKVKKAKAFGRGWGAVGSNSCSNVEFEDCVLNRIDFHEPCYDSLKINNSKIGDWGVLVTMIGDLYINNSTILNYEGGGNRGVIRSRSDTGGFCFGDLHVNNLNLGGYSGNPISSVILCQGNGILPSGSPIEAVMFNNIYINGLRGKYTNTTAESLLTSDSIATLNKPPRHIEVISVSGFAPHIDFGRFHTRAETVVLTMRDVLSGILYISDVNSKGTKIAANIDNLRGQGGIGTTLLNTANCNMEIINSRLVKYREYNTQWNTYSPIINIRGGQLLDNDYISVTSGTHNKRIACHGVYFENTSQTNLLSNAPKSRHYNCIFQGDAFVTAWSSTSAVNSGSFTINTAAGILDLIVGYGVNRKYLSIGVSQAQTYTLETGVTIVVTIAGTTATVTLNATSANLLGIRSTM